MKNIKIGVYGDYTILFRVDDNDKPLKNCQYVATYKFAEKDNTWVQGHYFNDLMQVVNFAYSKGNCVPSYDRLNEVASLGVDGLIQDDPDSAYEYFANSMELSTDEAEYFGIDKNDYASYVWGGDFE